MLVQRLRRRPDIEPALVQCSVSIGLLLSSDLSSVVDISKLDHDNDRREPIVGLMVAYRLRRWPNIEPALFQC